MALPSLLNQTRVPLNLHRRSSLTDTSVERLLGNLLGEVTLPVSRWLDLWKYIWWLLPCGIAEICRIRVLLLGSREMALSMATWPRRLKGSRREERLGLDYARRLCGPWPVS